MCDLQKSVAINSWCAIVHCLMLSGEYVLNDRYHQLMSRINCKITEKFERRSLPYVCTWLPEDDSNS